MTDSTTSSTLVQKTIARRTIRVRLPSGWVRTLLAGVTAAVLGWLITTALVLGGFWTVADNPWLGTVDWEDAQSFGGDLWAMAFGSPLHLASMDVITGLGTGADTVGEAVTFGAIPLLLSVFALILLRIFLLFGRGHSVHSLWFAVPAFVGTVVVEVAAAAPHVSLKPVSVGSLVVAVVATLWAAPAHLRAARRLESSEAQSESKALEAPVEAQPKSRLTWVWEGLRQGRTMVVGLVAVSLIALIATAWSHRQAVGDISALLGAQSGADRTFIWVFQALFGPNFMAWAASWLAGPGFYLGTDALHSPTSAPVAPIPAIPLLGAVPASAPGYRVIWLLIGVASLVGCWNRWRHSSATFVHQVGSGVVSVVLFAVVTFAWMSVSTLALGSARMSMLGPDAWNATLALTAEISVFSVLVTLLLHPTSVAVLRKWTRFAQAKLHQARDAEPPTESVIPGVEPQLRPAPLAPGAPTEAIKQPAPDELEPHSFDTDELHVVSTKAKDLAQSDEHAAPGKTDEHSNTSTKDKASRAVQNNEHPGSAPKAERSNAGDADSDNNPDDSVEQSTKDQHIQPADHTADPEADTEQFILSDTTHGNPTEQVIHSDMTGVQISVSGSLDLEKHPGTGADIDKDDEQSGARQVDEDPDVDKKDDHSRKDQAR